MSSTLPFIASDSPTYATPPHAVGRRSALACGIALLLGPIVLTLVMLWPSTDLVFETIVGHFWIVTSATLVAVCLALLMLRAAIVRQDGRVLLIGSGFLAISAVFLIHAVSTPGVVFADTLHATAWSTPIAIVAGAVLLALSTNERFAQQPWLVKRWRWWLLLAGMIWLMYAYAMLWYVPRQGMQMHMLSLFPSGSLPIYAASTCFYLLAAVVYGKRWRRTPTRPLAALTCGAILLAETSVTAHFGITWHVSFWLYHVLLLAAVLTVTYGIAIGYEQSGSLSSMVEGLLLHSTVRRQHLAFQRGMATLLDTLEHGDTARLPLLRRELRQRFALAEDQLDLLEHAVEVVAHEREEQRRLRALVDISRAATLDLDPDLLLQNALRSFTASSQAAVCAVGLVQSDQIVFAPQHTLVGSQAHDQMLATPTNAYPQSWFAGDDSELIGALPPPFATLSTGDPALLLPLRHHADVLGVLIMQPPHGTSIDERSITVCRSISAHLATALANARLFQELQHKHAGLLRSEQAREQLTQMIVHDLKNPLTAISAFLELLKMTDITAEQHELIDGARNSSISMGHLVSDMLDLARLEEGRMELHRTPSHITTILEACREEMWPWAQQGRKTLQIDAPDQLQPWLIDARLMQRVIGNLLSNAIKHTRSGTTITLGVATDADSLHIWVQNTGDPIPPDRLMTIFERFGAGSAQGAGQINTGLGLPFCKLAVEAHGGALTVRSNDQDGTRFTITLPVAINAEHLAA